MVNTVTRLRTNVLSLFALQVVSYAVPLFNLPYLARMLGAEQFGRLAFASAVTQYFIVLTGYGFHLSATREAALSGLAERQLATLLSAVTLLKLLIASAGMLALLGLLALLGIPHSEIALYTAAYVGVFGYALAPNWFLHGRQAMFPVTVSAVLGQLLSLLSVFAFVRAPGDTAIAAFLLSLAPVLGALFAWAWLLKAQPVAWNWPDFGELRRLLVDGWHAFVSTAGMTLYSASNTVILGLLATPASVAHFAVADKLTRAVVGLNTPVAEAVFPHVAALAKSSRNDALGFLAKLIRRAGMANLAISVALFTLATPTVEVLFGEPYAPAAGLIRWMAVLPLAIGISNVLGVQAMLNFDMKATFSRIIVSAGLLNLLLMIVLAERYGAVGAAASVAISEILVVAIMAAALHRRGLLRPLLSRAGP